MFARGYRHVGISKQLMIVPAVRFTSRVTPQAASSQLPSRLAALRFAKPKLSDFLADNFGRHHNYLRISITERCNLRCTYCMPEEGVPLSPDGSLLTTPEIMRLVRLFVSCGVTKIRLTGGEPTVRKDIVELVQQIGKVPGVEEICITSNGIALHRKLAALHAAGLTSLNLSLDTLVDGKFLLITRRNGLNAVLKSLRTALELGVRKVKLNVVVMKGINEDEVLDFVELARNSEIEVRFIEYMPFDGNKWQLSKMVSYEDILSNIRAYHEVLPVDHSHGDTAKVFQIPGFKGRIGFITSMTSNFCSTCTRLRITSDGNLKVCLFGNDEVSLRDLLRSGTEDAELLKYIGTAVKNKKEKHAGLGELENMPNRPMILIGNYRTFGRLEQRRLYSTKQKLTHVNSRGEANMVDIHEKDITHRRAVAVGKIRFSNEHVVGLIQSNGNKKGDVFSVARVAGIMGVKRCSDLIPLCHPLQITKVKVELELNADDNSATCTCQVECTGKTGVEMEAMTGVTVALLTVYDMCKAVDKYMVIDGVRVEHKSGGKSGTFDLSDRK